MNREDILKLIQQVWNSFFLAPRPAEVLRYAVRATSGTTGKPLVLINSSGAHESSRFADARRILLCMGSRDVRLSHICHVRRTSDGQVRRVLPLAAADLSPALTPLIADFMPDTVYGFPAFVGRVAQYVDAATARGVRSIGLGGECLTQALADRLAEKFPGVPVKMEYIATEVGAIGVSCGTLPPNHYHPAPGVRIDIDNPDESGAGEILITKRVNDKMTVEKYRVGDTVRILTGYACPCGAPLTFEHLGRSGYDYLKLSGGLVRRDELDRVSALFGGDITDYRAEVREVMEGGELTYKITLRAYAVPVAPPPERAAEITREFSRKFFLTPNSTLEMLVQSGLFLPLEIQFSQEPFPPGNKEIKLSLVRA